MSDTFVVKIAGYKQLKRDLRAVSKDMPKQVLRPAHQQVGAMVLPPARTFSPKGATGRLQRSHRVLASQRRVAIAAGSKRIYYGRMVFFGTGVRRNRKGANRGRVAENKWLDRALALVGESRIVSVYDARLGQLLARHGM